MTWVDSGGQRSNFYNRPLRSNLLNNVSYELLEQSWWITTAPTEWWLVRFWRSRSQQACGRQGIHVDAGVSSLLGADLKVEALAPVRFAFNDCCVTSFYVYPVKSLALQVAGHDWTRLQGSERNYQMFCYYITVSFSTLTLLVGWAFACKENLCHLSLNVQFPTNGGRKPTVIWLIQVHRSGKRRSKQVSMAFRMFSRAKTTRTCFFSRLVIVAAHFVTR